MRSVKRAVRNATMEGCIAPYLRHYSSHRPTDDPGSRLFVFKGEFA